MKCSFSFYPTFMLLLWVVVVISSLSFFGYVLSRPSLALWVEGVQPSGAYRHGKERLAEGEFEDALAAFRKGQAYFQRLYRESGLERMQVQWAVGLLLEANAYKDRGLGMDKEEAIRLFKAVVEVAPYLSEGQACASLGELYQEKEAYAEALAVYDAALRYCGPAYLIPVCFGRGVCLLAMGDEAGAAQSWYWFARYHEGAVAEWMWQAMADFPGKMVEGDYVRGQAWLQLGEESKALEALRRYAQAVPGDESARYYVAQLAGEGYEPSRAGVTPRIFGVTEEGQLRQGVVDWYVPEEGTYRMRVELAAEKAVGEAPIVDVWQGGKRHWSWTIDRTEFSGYESAFELGEGKKIFWLRVRGSEGEKPGAGVKIGALSWGWGGKKGDI